MRHAVFLAADTLLRVLMRHAVFLAATACLDDTTDLCLHILIKGYYAAVNKASYEVFQVKLVHVIIDLLSNVVSRSQTATTKKNGKKRSGYARLSKVRTKV